MKKHAKKATPKKKVVAKKAVSKKTVHAAHKTVKVQKTPYLLPLSATFAGISVLLALAVMYQHFFTL